MCLGFFSSFAASRYEASSIRAGAFKCCVLFILSSISPIRLRYNLFIFQLISSYFLLSRSLLFFRPFQNKFHEPSCALTIAHDFVHLNKVRRFIQTDSMMCTLSIQNLWIDDDLQNDDVYMYICVDEVINNCLNDMIHSPARSRMCFQLHSLPSFWQCFNKFLHLMWSFNAWYFCSSFLLVAVVRSSRTLSLLTTREEDPSHKRIAYLNKKPNRF